MHEYAQCYFHARMIEDGIVEQSDMGFIPFLMVRHRETLCFVFHEKIVARIADPIVVIVRVWIVAVIKLHGPENFFADICSSGLVEAIEVTSQWCGHLWSGLLIKVFNFVQLLIAKNIVLLPIDVA